jgi:RHS repeat-associated protein
MIHSIDFGGGGTAYYQYDSGKQRTRKRIDKQNGIGFWERIDLGGYERFRRYNGVDPNPVEEIESHHLFEGQQRVLLVDDVIVTHKTHADGRAYQTGPVYRYQYNNHLGSACLELDQDAGVISYEEYHPYGTSAYRAKAKGIEAPTKRYRYTGKERDGESGLYYYGARYYAASLGRWVSCDPASLVDGPNLYAFVGGNPVKSRDLKGTQTVTREEEETQQSLVNSGGMSYYDPNQLVLGEGGVIRTAAQDASRTRAFETHDLSHSEVYAVEMQKGAALSSSALATTTYAQSRLAGDSPRVEAAKVQTAALVSDMASAHVQAKAQVFNPGIPPAQRVGMVSKTPKAQGGNSATATTAQPTAASPPPAPAPATQPSPSPTLPQNAYSDNYLKAKFRIEQTKALKRLSLDDPVRKAMLDEKTGKVRSGRERDDTRGFEAGHADAKSSGLPQRFFLQDADQNATGGQTIESKGLFSSFQGIEVRPAVYVELGTAKQMERNEELPTGTVASAPLSQGWTAPPRRK